MKRLHRHLGEEVFAFLRRTSSLCRALSGDGKFLHGQNLAHPLSKGSLDMTGRRGRRNLDSLRRHRPLLRPVRARRGEPGSGRSLPPRAAGAGQVLPGNRSLSPPPLAPTPPVPAPPRHDGDAASPAPGRILAAMRSEP
ncbi:hypothetical protein AV530_011685 [Patagioenas fasciata monilis]|uniref:Uncharacterized protein n=1 Tax=Patagioenas fasciata monilis TaxID=372326 RepID=A0A1V4KLE4_PATFA|nr:hypothetical protein AV530_011685 [Patagioenas fasciata monilis]